MGVNNNLFVSEVICHQLIDEVSGIGAREVVGQRDELHKPLEMGRLPRLNIKGIEKKFFFFIELQFLIFIKQHLFYLTIRVTRKL